MYFGGGVEEFLKTKEFHPKTGRLVSDTINEREFSNIIFDATFLIDMFFSLLSASIVNVKNYYIEASVSEDGVHV